MKKLRRLLVVTSLLMVLSFILPVGQGGATTEDDATITMCNNGPPIDTIKCW